MAVLLGSYVILCVSCVLDSQPVGSQPLIHSLPSTLILHCWEFSVVLTPAEQLICMTTNKFPSNFDCISYKISPVLKGTPLL